MKIPKLILLVAGGFFLLSCLSPTGQEVEYDNTDDIEFFEEFAQQEGVQATVNGLLYKVIEEGNGDTPSISSRVMIHYHGTLITEEVFDSTYDRDEPLIDYVYNFIPGLSEGLSLMREGATYKFVIPSDLAYGNTSPGSPLYPGATVIFETELIEIVE